jgi:hypothetical protein
MAWKAVGPVVQKVVSRIVDTGEGSVAAEPRRRRKGPEPVKAPASSREETLPAKEVHASRWEYTATKAGAPHSEAVYCHLVVIEGGRRAGGGGRSPAYRSSPREWANELGWVVISGRAGARVSASGVPVHSSSPVAGAIPMADR